MEVKNKRLSKFKPRERIARIMLFFIPKRWKKEVFGMLRKHLGDFFHELSKQKESSVEEGHLDLDHVNICSSIPPKWPISSCLQHNFTKDTM